METENKSQKARQLMFINSMDWADEVLKPIKDEVSEEIGTHSAEKLPLELKLYSSHEFENGRKNLGYTAKDWFLLGWSEAIKKKEIEKRDYGHKNNFAKNLKIVRTARGYTQEELRIKCEVATTTILRWEAGDSEPTISKLIKLAEVLNVSVAYLVGAELKVEINLSEHSI